MFAHTHRHLEHWQVQLQIQLRLHRHTAVRTLATQKMWQPIEQLAISGAGHAISWCHGHRRADLRCCSDQAFRECKHQRAKPARGRAASRGSCFAPPFISAGMAVERAARWATPASIISIPAAGDELCRTQAPGPDRPPGGLPSGVWYTPAAAPLPAGAGEEARGPLDSGSPPLPGLSHSANSEIRVSCGLDDRTGIEHVFRAQLTF